MKNKEDGFQELVNRRKTLSKWFLLTLAFNILLQFEFVERLFTDSSHSQIVAQVLEVCGPSGEIRSAETSSSIGQALLFAGFSSGSFQLKLFTAVKNFKFSACLRLTKSSLSEHTFVLSLLPHRYSGLSPPLV